MKQIDKILYSKTNFYFIEDHYDIHLKGICIYKGKICAFKTICGDGHWGCDDESELENEFELESKWIETIPNYCIIYKLSFFEKIKKIFRKKIFELCVGYYWSPHSKYYKQRFHSRKPEKIYNFLYRFYNYIFFYKTTFLYKLFNKNKIYEEKKRIEHEKIMSKFFKKNENITEN